MLSSLLHLIVTAASLILIANVIPGIHIQNWTVAFIAAIVFGLVNLLIKPVLGLLTLPITFLTFGLFAFVLNAAMFVLTAWLVSGFEVAGFWSAVLGSLALGLLNTLIGSLFTGQNNTLEA